MRRKTTSDSASNPDRKEAGRLLVAAAIGNRLVTPAVLPPVFPPAHLIHEKRRLAVAA